MEATRTHQDTRQAKGIGFGEVRVQGKTMVRIACLAPDIMAGKELAATV